MSAVVEAAPRAAPRGSALEVLRAFAKLGLTSFGGPVAHLGYFRTEFVQLSAAVVGLLLAALYRPVWTSAILAPADFAIGIVAFLLLALWAVPPWLVVIFGAAAASVVARI